MQIEIAEVELGVAVALPGRAVEPFGGFGIVLGNALALGITHAEVDLCAGISLRGGFSIPLDSLGLVLWCAFSCRKTASKLKLSVRVSSIGVSLQKL